MTLRERVNRAVQDEKLKGFFAKVVEETVKNMSHDELVKLGKTGGVCLDVEMAEFEKRPEELSKLVAILNGQIQQDLAKMVKDIADQQVGEGYDTDCSFTETKQSFYLYIEDTLKHDKEQ